MRPFYLGPRVGGNELERLGLDESLEAYAARLKVSCDEARPNWRLGALHCLHVEKTFEMLALVRAGLCRIAPGVAVPTTGVVWSDEP